MNKKLTLYPKVIVTLFCEKTKQFSLSQTKTSATLATLIPFYFTACSDAYRINTTGYITSATQYPIQTLSEILKDPEDFRINIFPFVLTKSIRRKNYHE